MLAEPDNRSITDPCPLGKLRDRIIQKGIPVLLDEFNDFLLSLGQFDLRRSFFKAKIC